MQCVVVNENYGCKTRMRIQVSHAKQFKMSEGIQKDSEMLTFENFMHMENTFGKPLQQQLVR